MVNIGVAILGLGTVGGGTYQILQNERERIKNEYGIDIEVRAVLDTNTKRLKELGVPNEIRAKDIMDIVSNPDIDIVCELIGGIGIAKKFVETSLTNGKTVVTSNKELIAKYFLHLHELANHNRVGLYYEGSCLGGTPVIRTIVESLQANEITEIQGIVNGTTNYILSNMEDNNSSYDDALKEAKKLGYAENNPEADVDGYDASYKLSILSSLAFCGQIEPSKIYREGITKIKKEDILFAKELGYTIKLLAIGKKSGKYIEGRVHPTLVANDNPLASVKGSFNALKIVGNNLGEIMLYGQGAGALPTGSAVVSDIVFAGKFLDNCNHFNIIESKKWKNSKCEFSKDFTTKFYLRLQVKDKQGVLAKITRIISSAGISCQEVLQKKNDKLVAVPIVITTHETQESRMQIAIKNLEKEGDVLSIESVLHIE